MRLLPHKYSQVLAGVLIMLMVLTNPAFVAAVYAAGSDDSKDQTVITLDKSKQEEVNTAYDKNADKYKDLTDGERFTRFSNDLISYYLQNGKSHGPEWLKTTSINFSFTDDHKPVYSLETLQPFGSINDKAQLWFWQGRYAHSGDDSSTANFGFGWRKLSADKSSMLGLNTFYDYGFKYDLARIGMGVEYFNKLAEYRFNLYHPVSGDRQTGVDYLPNGIQYSYIRAVSGLDFELGTSLAQARWLNFYLNGYYYDNQYSDDEKGFKLRTTMQLTPRFLLELGYKDSNVTQEPYVQFKYQLADTFGPSLSDKHQPKDNDISYKLLQKVERENDIKTETFTKIVPYTGSIRTYVTTNSGAALQYAKVQAYQNGSPVGNAATTGADGVALISGLSITEFSGMEYTVKATYFGYNSNESAPVKVEKGQTASREVKVPINGGNASITVLNGQSQPISGASVTATLVTTAQAEKSLFDRIMGVKTAYAAESPFSVTVKTDSSGVAAFRNLPQGRYKFTVNADNATMSRQVDVEENSNSNATVVLVPSGGGNITAAVKDANGMLLSGVTVNVISGNTTKATKTTDSNGTVNFTGLAAGEYSLFVTLSGYGTSSASVKVTEGQAEYREIVLNGQTGSAAVTVTDGAKPVSGAMVTVTRNGMPVGSTTTDASGVAMFSDLLVGDYKFNAVVAGYISNGVAVSVSSGATASGTITLSRQTTAGSAVITIKGVTESLTAGVPVVVEARDNNGVARWEQINPSGEAIFNDLPEGTYTFEVNMWGYDKNSISNIVVSKGKVTTGTIVLTKWKVQASIKVSDDTKPLSGVMVIARNQGGMTFRAMTDVSGIATFNNLVVGEYMFTAVAAGYFDDGVTMNVGSDATAAATITLSRQTTAGSAVITIKGATEFLPPGMPVMVEARSNDGVVRQVQSNPSSEAVFNDLPEGTYTFEVNAPWCDKNSISNIVVSNGKISTGTIVLTRWKVGNASIQVSDGTKPLSGAMVTATRKQDNFTLGVNTDASGMAAFNNLPVGDYTFRAMAAGYIDAGIDVTVNSISSGAIAAGTIALSRQTVAGSAVITIKGATEELLPPGMPVMVEARGNNGVARQVPPNPAGEAIFNDLPEGTYTFEVNMPGYDKNNISNIVVSNGKISTGTIVLTRWKVGKASIKVSDGANPASGAMVTAVRNGVPLRSEMTDASGVAVFNDLQIGDYTFTTEVAGYTGAGVTVTVSSGATATGTITLTKQTAAGSASITVKDGMNPFLGVMGMVQAVGNNGVVRQAWTNPAGEAIFNDLPEGTYTFEVNTPGYDKNSITNIVISNGKVSRGTVVLTKWKVGNASIKVSEGANSVSGAMVTAVRNGVSFGGAMTDVSGVAVFNGLPEGTYTFEVNMPGYDKNSISNIVISNGKVSTGTIALTKWKVGNASIKISDGVNPVSGVIVTAVRNGMQLCSVMTDASGSATFTDLQTGEYTFSAEAAGYTGAGVKVTVGSGATATGTITLSKQTTTGSASITITDGTNPLGGVIRVEAKDSNGMTRQVWTNQLGVAIFNNLPAGTYTFAVDVSGYDKNSISNIVISNGKVVTGTIALTKWKVGNASIKVSDGTKTFSRVTVKAQCGTAGYSSSTITDALGTASFRNIPVGDYTFTAEVAGYTSDVAAMTISSGATAAGTITVSKQTTAGSAVITVMSADEIHLSSVMVQATGDNGVVRQAETGLTSEAIFNDLPAGTYTFAVNVPGYDKNSVGNIVISNGNVATYTIVLTPSQI